MSIFYRLWLEFMIWINVTNKILLVLVGVPGSGKSTWIQENGLENYTLSTDSFRLTYWETNLSIDQEEMISQHHNKLVFKKFYEALNIRMGAGLFTVLDATHLNVGYFEDYKKLASKYGYTLKAKVFHEDLEVLLERNKKRGFKEVSAEVVEKFYNNYLSFKLPEYVEEIETIKDLSNNILSFKNVEADGYNKIYYIGDIQWCSIELKKFLDTYYNEESFYVFTGDLLDRGPENDGVLLQILALVNKKNILFVKGNHDEHLEKYVASGGAPVGNREFDVNTTPQISRIPLSEMQKITDKLIYSCSLQLGNQRIFACHGGVTKLKDFITNKQLMRGVGDYESHEKCDNLFRDWSLKQNDGYEYYSVHWHRNCLKNPTKVNERVFNLEGQVEFGGALRVVVFEKDTTPQVIEIKSSTPMKKKENYYEDFVNNPLINVKD